MPIREFHVVTDRGNDYIETDACCVLGNLRNELKPDVKFTITEDGQPVDEKKLAKIIMADEALKARYENYVARAKEKRERRAREEAERHRASGQLEKNA